jgi:anthranilate synthase component 1
MEVITVFLHLLQSYRFYKIENEIIYKTFPDGTRKKQLSMLTQNIPEVIQEFSGSLNQKKL